MTSSIKSMFVLPLESMYGSCVTPNLKSVGAEQNKDFEMSE